MASPTKVPPDQEGEVKISERSDQIIEVGKKLIEAVSGSVTGEITKAMDAISGVAQKGTIVFLQSFGAALIVFCIVMKVEIGSRALGVMTSGEYIATLVAGFLFVMAGTAMRFYILRAALQAQKDISEAGQDIMKAQIGAANRQVERITDAASGAFRRKEPQLPAGV
jgi:hypothetical protein